MTTEQIEALKKGMEDQLEYDQAIAVLCDLALKTTKTLIEFVGTHPDWREMIQANFDAIGKVSKLGMERNKRILEQLK